MARTKKAFISTVKTTPDICTGDIWQHKMQVRGDFSRPPHGTDKSVINDNINWRDVQIKKVVNNVDMPQFKKNVTRRKNVWKLVSNPGHRGKNVSPSCYNDDEPSNTFFNFNSCVRNYGLDSNTIFIYLILLCNQRRCFIQQNTKIRKHNDKWQFINFHVTHILYQCNEACE